MMTNDNNNSQYIEGNSRIRIALFAFLGCWGLIGFLLKTVAEKKLEQINALGNATEALSQMNDIFLKFLILPLSMFCTIQGIYLLWLGTKTIRAGIHPPPGVNVPFRTRIQTGSKAKLSGITYLFAGACNFVIIVLLFAMRHEIFRRI
jgi:hypothetical protein